MDDSDRACLVRMGVALGGTPVRGPSRMPDADAAGKRGLVEQVAQVAEFADGAADFHVAGRRQRGDTGRIVAAIFETAEAAEQDRAGFARTDITDYSAHRSLFKEISASTRKI